MANLLLYVLSMAIAGLRQNVAGTARSSTSGRGTAVEMVYDKVFVAGGSKGVGRAVIDKLVEQGSEVVALVRREDAKAELEAIKGERDEFFKIEGTC